MRTPTLFAVAIASLLINFSDAARSNSLHKRIAPVDGVIGAVTAGGTGNIVTTAAGLVTPPPNPSSDRKKKRDGLPLVSTVPNLVSGVNVAGLGSSAQGVKQNKSGGVLGKRGLSIVNGLLGGSGGGSGGSGGGSGGSGGSGGRGGNDRDSSHGSSRRGSSCDEMSYYPDDRHSDYCDFDDEITKRSNMEKRGLLGGGGGGLPVVGGFLGGGGSEKEVVKQAANRKSRGRNVNGGRGRDRGRGRNQKNNRKAQPASTGEGGHSSGGGGLPIVGDLLKRGLLGGGGGGLPVVGGFLGGGGSEKKVVKQAANRKGRGRNVNGGRGRDRGRGRNQKNNRKAQPASTGKGGLLGGGVPVVGGLLG